MLQNKNLSGSAENALGKKEKIAIIAGFFLIVLVLVVTLVRSIGWHNSPATAVSDNSPTEKSIADYDTISSKDLQQMVLEKKGATLVDIRSFDDFIAQHIVDSMNIPAADIAGSTKIKPTDNIFIIGADDNDSDVPTAVDALKNSHFANVKVLAGGLAAWELNGGQTVSFGDPTSFVDQAKVYYATAQQAHDMIQNDPGNTFVLDIRDASAFAQGHVLNAVNIPLLDLERRRTEIPLMKKVLVFGVTDVEEFQAGVQLYDLTQTTAYVVKGAMQGWQDAKFPIAQ